MKRAAMKGRGAAGNPDNRFDTFSREAFDDGWDSLASVPSPDRRLIVDATRSVIVRNDSPDVPFRQSINPYRGCEHGCIYCFARPSHAYLGYSPGLDFETRLHYKPDAAERLREELARPGYSCEPIALGVNTDAYQPIERQLGINRGLLQVMLETRHPVSLITKSALVERDIDLLRDLAKDGLVEVMVSLTTLDLELARRMEPRAAAPHRRLQVIERLSESGVPVGVLTAPLIPFVNDQDLEALLRSARRAGAVDADYVLLRLPLEVGGLFEEWLAQHYPERRERVMNRIRDCRGGKVNDSRFGTRMRGEGIYARLLRSRFDKVYRDLGFRAMPGLECGLFAAPADSGGQLDLFGGPGSR
jgi:DNA repair photolyase